MIIVFQLVTESGDSDGTEAALSKRGAVCSASHERDKSPEAGNTGFLCRAEKQFGKLRG